MPATAIDLFCGAGGLTHGMQNVGINVAAGIDFDENCRYAYERNNNTDFIHRRIQDVTAQDLIQYYPEGDVKILVGCAPCQPFSAHTNKYKKTRIRKDDRWYLLNDFFRLIKELNPDIVSMENVPNLIDKDVFHSFVNRLRRAKYKVSFSVVYCPDYGIPQQRNRLVLLASRYGKIRILEPTHDANHYETVRDTIGELERIDAGEISLLDPLHRASKLSERNIRRIKASIPGGTWHDWDDSLLSPCHRKESGQTYASVYARMEWDKPSPTITTEFYNYGTGRFGHPEQDRALSLREGALLQTFPPDYVFSPIESLTYKEVGKMIGNAVPVRLGEVIGLSILNHIDEYQQP